jgi:hypothetical protein
MAAGGSASIEPKFPCPLISGDRKEKSWKKQHLERLQEHKVNIYLLYPNKKP